MALNEIFFILYILDILCYTKTVLAGELGK